MCIFTFLLLFLDIIAYIPLFFYFTSPELKRFLCTENSWQVSEINQSIKSSIKSGSEKSKVFVSNTKNGWKLIIINNLIKINQNLIKFVF